MGWSRYKNGHEMNQEETTLTENQLYNLAYIARGYVHFSNKIGKMIDEAVYDNADLNITELEDNFVQAFNAMAAIYELLNLTDDGKKEGIEEKQ